MTESVQTCFELSIHFPVFFSRELFLVAAHGWFTIQTNEWKVQNTTLFQFESFKDGVHFSYCAYVLRISGWSEKVRFLNGGAS